MSNQKDIRRRIKSIKNTKKITRAMEMVSAAKMRKAISQVLAIRPYANSAWKVLSNLSVLRESGGSDLLEIRDVKKVLAIIVASNRGLCGSFNSQVYKKIREEVSKKENEKLEIDFISVGKKGEPMVKKLGKELVASFIEIGHTPNITDVRSIAKIALDRYREKIYDRVVLVYTDYVSPMLQIPKSRQLLPVSKKDLEEQIEDIENIAKKSGITKFKQEYTIEPDPKEIIEVIIPRIIEMQVYHGILESKASEESSRMIAMKNATDAAGEMAEELTLAYNQLRQAKITQEISEISAGRVALED